MNILKRLFMISLFFSTLLVADISADSNCQGAEQVVPYATPIAECLESGGLWNQNEKICYSIIDKAQECVTNGGSWNEMFQSCEAPEMNAQICIDTGGSWDSDHSNCDYPPAVTYPENQSDCESVGATWDSDNSRCNLTNSQGCSWLGGTWVSKVEPTDPEYEWLGYSRCAMPDAPATMEACLADHTVHGIWYSELGVCETYKWLPQPNSQQDCPGNSIFHPQKNTCIFPETEWDDRSCRYAGGGYYNNSCSFTPLTQVSQDDCDANGGVWNEFKFECEHLSIAECLEAGGLWEQYSKTCYTIIDRELQCITNGGNWNDLFHSCEAPEMNEQICTDTSGSWDSDYSRCAYPSPVTYPENQSDCESVGATWDSDNSRCNLTNSQGCTWLGGTWASTLDPADPDYEFRGVCAMPDAPATIEACLADHTLNGVWYSEVGVCETYKWLPQPNSQQECPGNSIFHPQKNTCIFPETEWDDRSCRYAGGRAYGLLADGTVNCDFMSLTQVTEADCNNNGGVWDDVSQSCDATMCYVALLTAGECDDADPLTIDGVDKILNICTYEADSDGDGISDTDDTNPDDGPFADADGDGLLNFEDSDDDNDGMPDTYEQEHAPWLDQWSADANEDADNDGVSNIDEMNAHTSPLDKDDKPSLSNSSDINPSLILYLLN